MKIGAKYLIIPLFLIFAPMLTNCQPLEKTDISQNTPHATLHTPHNIANGTEALAKPSLKSPRQQTHPQNSAFNLNKNWERIPLSELLQNLKNMKKYGSHKDYFHVTSSLNLVSIILNGLEPKHGGVNPQGLAQLNKEQFYPENSKNLIHLCTGTRLCLEGNSFYAFKHLGAQAVLLRISKDRFESEIRSLQLTNDLDDKFYGTFEFESETYDSQSKVTSQHIPPQWLEIWQPQEEIWIPLLEFKQILLNKNRQQSKQKN